MDPMGYGSIYWVPQSLDDTKNRQFTCGSPGLTWSDPVAHTAHTESTNSRFIHPPFINGYFRNLSWRYRFHIFLAYFSGLNFREYHHKIWPYMTFPFTIYQPESPAPTRRLESSLSCSIWCDMILNFRFISAISSWRQSPMRESTESCFFSSENPWENVVGDFAIRGWIDNLAGFFFVFFFLVGGNWYKLERTPQVSGNIYKFGRFNAYILGMT